MYQEKSWTTCVEARGKKRGSECNLSCKQGRFQPGFSRGDCLTGFLDSSHKLLLHSTFFLNCSIYQHRTSQVGMTLTMASSAVIEQRRNQISSEHVVQRAHQLARDDAAEDAASNFVIVAMRYILNSDGNLTGVSPLPQPCGSSIPKR